MGKLRPVGRRIAPSDNRRIKAPPKRADPELLTPEHRAWRAQVLARAGHRCEWVEQDGRRCDRSAQRGDRLVADHVVERADGGALLDVRNGQCLCVQHNTIKGIRARAARVVSAIGGGGSIS